MMKKKLLSMLLSTALVVGMTVVWMPMEVSAGNGSGGVCPYGDANCSVKELDGTHNHEVRIGTGCAQNTITGGTFTGVVIVHSGGKISNGTFDNTIQVEDGGEISGGTFNAEVMNFSGAKIADGTFQGRVENSGTIVGGSYAAGQNVVNCNGGNITGGMFYGEVSNNSGSDLNGGEYYAKVTNFNGNIHAGSFYGEVTNWATIQDGYFYGQVMNEYYGTITGGSYRYTIINNNPTLDSVKGERYGLVLPSGGSSSGLSGASAHTHSYFWVTVKEVSMGEDGLEEYRCSCGDVAERVVIPASEYYVKQLYGDIRFADENGEVRFDAGGFHTISDYLLTMLQSRQDVKLTITFTYKGTSYEAVFAPNTDYTELLNDTEQFYGLLGLNGRYGVAVSAVA